MAHDYILDQNIIEQLEALADQPGKRAQFNSLLGKMPRNTITAFFKAYHQYFMVLEAFHKDKDKTKPESEYIEEAKKNIENAKRQVDTMLRRNPDSIPAQYLKALMEAKFSYDSDHNPVLRGSNSKWIEQATLQLDSLSRTGFGPAIHQFVQLSVLDESAINARYLEGANSGSVLCKAQFAQRYFSSLLNNVTSDQTNPFTLPDRKHPVNLIKDLKDAIQEGDYESISYLTRYISDACGALKAVSQAHEEGSREVSQIKLEKLRHLAVIAKELSMASGDDQLSRKIDAVVGKAHEVAEKFLTELEKRTKDPSVQVLLKAEAEAKVVAANKEKREKQVSQSTKELIGKFNNADQETHNLFLNHPKLKGEEKPNSPRILRQITNLVTPNNTPLTKKKIESKLSKQEIESFLKDCASKKIQAQQQPLESSATEVQRLTSQLMSDEAKEACKAEFAELRKLTDETQKYTETTFAKAISRTLETPRDAITMSRIEIGSMRRDPRVPHGMAPTALNALAEKVSAILKNDDKKAFVENVKCFYEKYQSTVEKSGGINAVLAKVNNPSTRVAEFKSAYQKAKPLPSVPAAAWTSHNKENDQLAKADPKIANKSPRSGSM